MKKAVYTNLKAYQFDPARRGAKYSFDGIRWMNGGELKEAESKYCMGYECAKDANTAFDAGSDIEELHMSIKSSKATLTNEILGKDMETSLDCYFARVASTCWGWVILMDDTLTIYIMDADEFRTFTESWAGYNNEGRIRYKATSGKMISWLEERV